jgi:uncharacterized protein YcsI (UPF0317 family)
MTDMLTEAQQARLAMRRGEWTGPTPKECPGYVQCNLVVLPQRDAYDFVVYCQRNFKACPLLEVTDVGDPEPRLSTPGADLRTDLPRYAIYRNGAREEDVFDISDLWRDDSVGFLIGSGITFDPALNRAGVPTSKKRWVLETNLPTVPSGKFRGPVIVTMRWMTPAQAITATQVTSRFYLNHGAPIHIGDPAAIGADIGNPIYGEPLHEMPEGLIPVFWACGVTPQYAAIEAKLELMISHSPGHAFITDLKADELCLP